MQFYHDRALTCFNLKRSTASIFTLDLLRLNFGSLIVLFLLNVPSKCLIEIIIITTIIQYPTAKSNTRLIADYCPAISANSNVRTDIFLHFSFYHFASRFRCFIRFVEFYNILQNRYHPLKTWHTRQIRLHTY